MATFEFPDTHYFAKLVEAVSVITSEPNITLNGNGLWMRDFDPAHIAYVNLKVAGRFRGDPVTIVISLPNLLKVLRRSKGRHELLGITANSADKMVDVTFSEKIFTIPFTNLQSSHDIQLPEYDAPVRITMEAKQFSERLDDMGILSDEVTLAVEKSTLAFSGKGEKSHGQSTLKLSRDTGSALGIYPLEYLRTIMAFGATGFKDVRIRFGTNTPIIISFPVEGGSLDYYVATKLGPETPKFDPSRA